MADKDTIVIKFGASAGNGFAIWEYDDVLNVDSSGNVKKSFGPGDVVYFLIHHEPGLFVGDILVSSGQVVFMGIDERARSQEVTFDLPGETRELGHIPSSINSDSWDGRNGQIEISGRVITAQDAPCVGDINYTIRASLYKFIPSRAVDELTGDNKFRSRVVVVMEAI